MPGKWVSSEATMKEGTTHEGKLLDLNRLGQTRHAWGE